MHLNKRDAWIGLLIMVTVACSTFKTPLASSNFKLGIGTAAAAEPEPDDDDDDVDCDDWVGACSTEYCGKGTPKQCIEQLKENAKHDECADADETDEECWEPG